MEFTPELITLLQLNFNWNLSRAKCIAAILVGVLKLGTVNLATLCLSIAGSAKIESKYRRLQRLFSEVTPSPDKTAKFIADRFKSEKYVLSMDRTNWKFGAFNINILVIGIVYDGIAIPIVWIFLSKKGNSNTNERIALMNRYIALFGADSIECLVADREFVGHEWFSYLYENKIKIRIRIKKDARLSKRRGGKAPAGNFCRSLKLGETYCLDGKRELWGLRVYVTCTRLESDYLIIVSFDMPGWCEIINDYKKRWKIEVMFKALKSGGFDFEDTHLKCPKKLELLMEFLAIAFCWACIAGEYRNNIEEIKTRAHKRKSYTLFRYGLDFLKEIFLNPAEKSREVPRALALLKSGVEGCTALIL